MTFKYYKSPWNIVVFISYPKAVDWIFRSQIEQRIANINVLLDFVVIEVVLISSYELSSGMAMCGFLFVVMLITMQFGSRYCVKILRYGFHTCMTADLWRVHRNI